MSTNLPASMRAIVQTVYGAPEVLHFAEAPLPELRPRDLLIQVKAAAINPVDTKRRRGGPPGEAVPDGYKIVGWDAAGVVVALGTEASIFQVGDEVYCAGDMGRNGAYAEYVAVDERIVGRKPHTLSFPEAAAVPLTALTAWEGLIEMLGAERGDAGTGGRVCLVVGGAGGAGSMGIQIARQVCGLRVVATASRPQSAGYCRRMGAEAVIDHYGSLRDQLQTAGYGGADYIYNTAPLSNFPQLAAALSPLGKICSILGPPDANTLNVSPLFAIRGTLAFELMFTRPMLGVEMEKQGLILNQVAGLLDNGTLQTTLTQLIPWQEVVRAHETIEAGHAIGKTVLQID